MLPKLKAPRGSSGILSKPHRRLGAITLLMSVDLTADRGPILRKNKVCTTRIQHTILGPCCSSTSGTRKLPRMSGK